MNIHAPKLGLFNATGIGFIFITIDPAGQVAKVIDASQNPI